MAQEVRQRQQRTVKYSSNGKQPESLSRGMVYRELRLQLEGQIDLPLADNDEADILRGDEWALVKRIDIIANNTDTIKSFSGNELWWLNYFQYGIAPTVTPALGAGGDDPAFNSVLILPFWIPNSIRPIDTALDARQLSDLKIEITWGTHTDVSAGATGFIVEPTVKVSSLESFNVKGPFSQWRLFAIEREVTADNPQFQIQLPVGPMYRGFLINTTDAGVDASDILNNFKWKAGTTVFADMNPKVMQEAQRVRSRQVREFNGFSYLNLRRGDANDVDGWYYYDHVTDGLNSEAVDTLGFSEIELELDVSVGAGTTKVIVIPQQLIPIRGRNAK